MLDNDNLIISNNTQENSNIKEDFDESVSRLEKWLISFSSFILFILLDITFRIDDRTLIFNREFSFSIYGSEISLRCSTLFSYGPFIILLFHLMVFYVFYDFSKNLLETNTSNLEVIKKFTMRDFLVVPFIKMILDKNYNSALRNTRLTAFWLLIFVLPLLTLSWAQISFIKYHEPSIIWIQSLWIFIEIILVFSTLTFLIPSKRLLWKKETMILRTATMLITILLFFFSLITCYLAAKILDNGWINFFRDNTFFNLGVHKKRGVGS